MRSRSQGARAGTVATALAAFVALVGAGIPAAHATAPRARAWTAAVAGHRYRHGLTTRVGDAVASPDVSTLRDLSYSGGTSAPGYASPVGVTTGAPRVYLVYWGSQWGSASVDGNGDTVLAGDPSGIAPVQQEFFRGLGTPGDTWSGVMTQYCEDTPAGSLSCAGSSARVGYPTGGALAGVWADTAHAAPASATGHQLAVEAVAAAGHFGNTNGAANRNAQYVIVSPTGTDPDGWLDPFNGFCAWHDYNADSFLSGGAASSPYGAVAFTNMPYLPDVGASCGAGFVNSPGTLDGVTIVGGHEYAETITDQFPGGGWLDVNGEENGDKCAWLSTGGGASQDITLTTGTFAVQTTWANDAANGAGACEVAHPIGVSLGPTITTLPAATFASTRLQSFTVHGAGGATTVMSESGALPPGISLVPGLRGSARLTGIAPAGSEGVYPVTIIATGPAGATAQPFTLTVVPTRKFTSPALATFAHGVPTTFNITTRGSFGRGTRGLPQTPALSEVGALPAGLTFHDNGDGSATISGTASVVGTTLIYVHASAGITLVQRLTIKVT